MPARAVKDFVLFNSSRARLAREVAAFAAGVPKGALILDAGAGTGPYRDYFAHAHYESADFQQVDKEYAQQTYVCDLGSIPVEDERYDGILFTQVMEHLNEPKVVLRELFRVLKPDGKLLYTGPLFYEEHEKPYDFYRFTQFGLRYLFGDAGFQIERLERLEGYLGTVAYQLTGMARHLPIGPARLGGGVFGLSLAPAMLLIRLLSGLLAVAFHRLEMKLKITELGYPKNYVLIARKPARIDRPSQDET